MITFLILFAILSLSFEAGAEDSIREVFVHHEDSGIRIWDFSSPDTPPGPCFPHGCGGIEGPFRNPNPDARNPENLTACMYGADGFLVYEREGKVCPYQYIDSTQSLVEQRRQEWLRSKQ